ncbi:hypothetical protein RJ640_012547 [Escallonia rubra]|uniref:Uncharacterized protein n=1 Tax=Escallonia rubra TaxID=112253 RepID=A0AA88RR20_9ASTE|nr:hypothetical protein RJ640_012547 [Escallonia rubra]
MAAFSLFKLSLLLGLLSNLGIWSKTQVGIVPPTCSRIECPSYDVIYAGDEFSRPISKSVERYEPTWGYELDSKDEAEELVSEYDYESDDETTLDDEEGLNRTLKGIGTIFMMLETYDHEEEMIPLSNTIISQSESIEEETPGSTINHREISKIKVGEIYKNSIFRFRSKMNVEISEGETSVDQTEERILDIPLFKTDKAKQYFEEGYHYVHIGMIQVSLCPLFIDDKDTPIICCLADNR